MGFFTKTLPMLGRAFDKALASDQPFLCPPCFAVQNKNRIFSDFLREFFWLVFNSDGKVAADPLDAFKYVHQKPHTEGESVLCRQVAAVRAIRQIAYLLYKLDGGHSPESEADVITNFVSTDAALPDVNDEVPLCHKSTLALENARILIWKVLRRFDPYDITPRHGPGCVATGEKAWEKMKFSRLYESLEKEYPFADYNFLNYTHLCDDLEILEQLELHQHSTAKVALVPKDSRGPRLISMEPLELQWIQQGLMHSLVRTIESSDSITAGYVNFTTQEVNRGLALEASAGEGYINQYVTIDLKDASDRVSLWLVKKLFPEHIYNCLYACRSQRTKLPNGRTIALRKFAPMGSSVCFPVEALCFWAIAVGALLANTCISFRMLDMKSKLPKVYTYGDDLILMNEDYKNVANVFEDLFLKINEDKCCTGRFFRESCGMDAFRLNSVTPVRVKAHVHSDKLSLQQILSTLSYVNNFKSKEYWFTTKFLEDKLIRDSGPVLRTKNSDIQYAVYCPELTDDELFAYLSQNFRMRINHAWQKVEIRVKVPSSRTKSFGDPGWLEMLKLFSQNSIGLLSSGKGRHIEPGCYTLPHGVKMRWAWIAIESLMSK